MSPTRYRYVAIDDLNVFYRETGPSDAPAVLLLHGFPSSSRMWQPLIDRLGDRYRMVAPDYPGFGHSDAPPPDSFSYTFDHLADYVERLHRRDRPHAATRWSCRTTADPSAFAWRPSHPNGSAHSSCTTRSPTKTALARCGRPAEHSGPTAPATSKRCGRTSSPRRHTSAARRHAAQIPTAYDPDLWTDELAFLNRPGQRDIQTDLFYDYRTNVASYPVWQQWLRETQPPLLVVWGRYDPSFEAAEAEAYRRDVPNAEVHVLDAGHFALDEAPDLVADLIGKFLDY